MFKGNRKKQRLLFTSGLMSTLHKALVFCVINQTRLVRKVEVSPWRARPFLPFLSFELDQRFFQRYTLNVIPVNVLKYEQGMVSSFPHVKSMDIMNCDLTWSQQFVWVSNFCVNI